MMYTTKLLKLGGSAMLEVPPTILKRLDLSAGLAVNMAVEQDCMVVSSAHRPRYILDELIAKCDATAEISTDHTWLNAKSVGNERSNIKMITMYSC